MKDNCKLNTAIWNIYEIHICTAVVDENEEWSSEYCKFSNLSNWKEEAWKYQRFNGIRTRDLRDTGAMLDQLSCEATNWERGQFFEFISSRVQWSDVKYIYKIHIVCLLYTSPSPRDA